MKTVELIPHHRFQESHRSPTSFSCRGARRTLHFLENDGIDHEGKGSVIFIRLRISLEVSAPSVCFKMQSLFFLFPFLLPLHFCFIL